MDELGVFGHVGIAFDSSVTDDLDNLNAVVASIDTPCALQSARKQAVFYTFRAVLESFSSFTQL